MAKRLALVRHGECDGGSDGRLIGRRDAPLTEGGRAQAVALRPLLASMAADAASGGVAPGEASPSDAATSGVVVSDVAPGDVVVSGVAEGTTALPDTGFVVVCSPRVRARETASLALAGSGAEPVVDPDLREIDFGEWEGLTFAEAARQRPELVARWAAWDPDFTFPGGESLMGFVRRIEGVAVRLKAQAATTVVCFTHGGVTQVLLCSLLGLSPRHHLAFSIGYGAVATVDLQGELGVLSGLVEPLRLGETLGSQASALAWGVRHG